MDVQLPPPTDARWAELVEGRVHPEFLGAQVMVGRLEAAYRQSPTSETLEECCREIHALYYAVQDLPKVHAELERLFGQAPQFPGRTP